jgi:hypothetical protein
VVNGTCSTYEKENAYRVSVGKPAGKIQLGRPKCTCEVKVKFSLEQAMKAQRGSRGIAILFL